MRLFLVSLFLFSPLFGQEFAIYTESGTGHYLNVDPQETIGNILANINSKSATLYRDYLAEPTPEEKTQIAFIVNTMGMSSLAKIAKQKSSLKKAGARVDHVHPIRFLQVIFLDGKMKASMQALYGRSWVWSEFLSGLEQSLDEEQAKDNILPEHIQDFAQSLNLSFDAIYPMIQQSQWDNFIKFLLKSIPRNEDADRYNM